MVRLRLPPRHSQSGQLVWMMIALAMTFALMAWARQPDHWRWLWTVSPVAVEKPQAESFAQADDRGAGTRPPSRQEGRMVLSETDLGDVRDDTMRVADGDSWFRIWQRLPEIPATAWEQDTWGYVAHAQLTHQPDVYRGAIVTVRGSVRRAQYIQAPENNFGVQGYWQLWVAPDRGPRSPFVVYCASLPPGFPTGNSMAADIICHGIFYKRWAYASQDGVRTAPLLVSSQVQWIPPQPAARGPEMDAGQIVLMVALSSIVAGFLAYGVYRSTRNTSERIRREISG